MGKITTAQSRKYAVVAVDEAKKICISYLKDIELDKAMKLGLPEIDDRYHIWRIALMDQSSKRIGEIVIDAKTSLIDIDKTSSKAMLEERLLGRDNGHFHKKVMNKENRKYILSNLRNTIALGDSEEILQQMPAESVDLIFTSPPYYNARPQYSEYVSYEDYLLKLRKVIQQCYRVLGDGRFFAINTSPVLVRRMTRNDASRRIAVPFDLHRIFIEEGYDFIDDIIWMKPEGAGWATGRGRRFAADRNPLQYKAVPVTEYILVYRKKTDKLIDWYIRKHPNRKIIAESKIPDGYEKTNVWKIKPAHNKKHPAVFPIELAMKVVQYYSFREDVVLDPFAGIGTVGEAASLLDRKFVLIELEREYIEEIKKRVGGWLEQAASEIKWINTDKPSIISYQERLV